MMNLNAVEQFRRTPTRYLVTACGVSVICDTADSVIKWMQEFVKRGGTPEVREFDGE